MVGIIITAPVAAAVLRHSRRVMPAVVIPFPTGLVSLLRKREAPKPEMMAWLAATGIELALRFARLVPFSSSSIDSAGRLRLLAESVRSSRLDEFESRGNPVRKETENTL